MQQEIAANAKIECDKATRAAEKARYEAENAKLLALKEKLQAQQSIDLSKRVVEQAHTECIEAKEKLKKQKLLLR